MCGFLGEISNQLLNQQDFKNLLDLSINRGPDQQGFWKQENCQLGFNRLAILDLSEKGKQPFLSPSGRFAIVFNGEVYNYKELQQKYNIDDKDLRSSSDSEILAHLIDTISIDVFVKELNGMFAVTIWEIETEKLYLIRDFAGIKPLFYGIHSDGIVFASQFDQIFKHQAFKNKKLRPEIMKEFFGLGYMSAPNTVFENIFQVEPGTYIAYDFKTKTIEKIKYFDWVTSSKHEETDAKTVAFFSDIFNNVVKNQLNADVPVATFFSGGIDSPLVAAISLKHDPKIRAYTMAVNDKNLNEAEIAQKMAKQIGIQQVIETINDNDILNLVEEHFKNLPEPFGDYSSLPTYLITKKAKKFATVMLSGDGGDELFWGYPRFLRSINHLFWFKMPLSLRKMIVPLFRKFNKNLSSAIDVFKNYEEWILYKQIHFSYLEQFVPKTNFSSELLSLYKFDENLTKKNTLIYLKKNEFYAHMQRTLRKVDLMSMANSLEVRVPFLDKKIIDFSNTINPKYGISHNNAKYILRKLLNQFIDNNLINLPKKGFSVPIEKWLQNELKHDVIATLLETEFYGEEFIDKKTLKTLVNNFFENKQINPWGIWHLYSWQKWAINNQLI